MNDTLVEAIVRGIAKAKGIEICADASYWHSKFGPLAQAALTAITEAGYVCVPHEPTAEMLASVDDEDSDKYVARGRAYSAWQAMIATHAKGEME